MTTLRAADRRPQVWRNGGGVTREIAVGGRSLDGSFDWRVSMADVTVPGSFSTFVDVDRAICILDGKLRLELAGRLSATLDRDANPFTFAGDAPAYGTPLDGGVLDLNVMVRRSHWQSDVGRSEGSGSVAAAEIVIIIATSRTAVNGVGLDMHDAILLERPPLPISFQSDTRVYTIRLLRDGLLNVAH